MLPKKFRLQRREIEELKSLKNKIIQGRFFGLIYQKLPSERKFALIISNKISNKATVRNKIKRLFYRVLEKEQLSPEGRFLFLAKKSCLAANLEDFEAEVKSFKSRLER